VAGAVAAVSASATGGTLAAILHDALTDPASLQPATLRPLCSAIHIDPPGVASTQDVSVTGGSAVAEARLALDALAAVLYARPELVDDALLDRLAALARTDPLPPDIASTLAKVLRFLAASPAAPRAWVRLGGLLADPSLNPAVRDRLLPLVEDFVQWREDLVGLDGVLAVAESAPLAGHRAFLLDYGVERFVFCSPEAFTEDRLQRLSALFADAPRYRHVLYALAARRALARGVRALLARQLDGHFPLHATAGAILAGGPMRLLVALNVGMGQGDDVVRLVPLLQGLLDANPALTITLITHRPYLYDSPRLRAVAIADDTAAEAVLREPYDGVLEFFQPGWPAFTFRAALHPAIEGVRLARPPAFVVEGDLGRASDKYPGDRSPFLYQRVELGGSDIAEARGLDQKSHRSIYEPGLRLLGELGLPQRAAEEPPLTPSVLTGVPSPDAERAWESLAAGDTAAPRRPVALLNPFGGSGPTKGFLEQSALLAAEIAGLVDEGYRIVLLPNGTDWGGLAAIGDVLARLEPAPRAHVVVAPNPKEADEAKQLTLQERPELKYEDRVTRLFKYFTVYADLVVTVEGWLAHFAYNLGRPFRLFVAAGSFSSDWFPHGRSRSQQLTTTLSPYSRAAHSDAGLLRAGDPPPMPHRPRKDLLEVALAGLGRAGGAEAVVLLQRALASPDCDVRTWATAALGQCASETRKAALLGALDDPWPTVVREAADALLREGLDCSRELGTRFREQLQLHADVVRRNWEVVRLAGPAALPALFRAGKSENEDVRSEARALLRQLLGPYVPGLEHELSTMITRPLGAR
jgi:hypothetical protein